ncbi:RteC domain-containing protein [Pedobacter endophyticus]|uniref:RteC domain-containing protein n=1 Tax=Pedobacter endophyticus TaxID=2789740 RepID=A0A7U3Q4X0_9SPHI|nr:RteC domain-containing protein [Pedobacter endophyticus]QPH38656.1 RteC domain-containing protein [Pedobacter endophyticus]
MLIQTSEQLYLEMTAKLHAVKQEPISDLTRFSSSLDIIEKYITRLNALVNQLGFPSEMDEILFFKETKPKFYSCKILIVEQFNILSNIPIDTDEAIRSYYVREIDFLRRYFEQNKFLYQYYLNNQTAMDQEYFLIKNKQNLPALKYDEFDTNVDYTFAKFRAYEQLREFLLTRIRLIYNNPDSSLYHFLARNSQLKWTDDKISLVELAYGIYFMGSLNNGKADISQVVDILERSLNIDLGVAYRKFIDISRRKNKGYTVYLDGMRSAINEHIIGKQRFS